MLYVRPTWSGNHPVFAQCLPHAAPANMAMHFSLKILFTICVQIVSIPMILPVKNAMICLNEFQSDKQSIGKQ